jgi:hypothetical protein
MKTSLFVAGALSLAGLLGGCFAPGAASGPLSIEEARRACGLPAPCASKLPCEGGTLVVRALVDPANIADRRSDPRLADEKFLLRDPASGQTLEAYAVSRDNARLFEKLRAAPANAPARVSGTVVGLDLPMQGRCVRDVRMQVASPADITFER